MQMFQVVETYQGVTRVKMIGSYKKCQARVKQLKDSKRKSHNYKCDILPTEDNEKFNTRTPGIWNKPSSERVNYINHYSKKAKKKDKKKFSS